MAKKKSSRRIRRRTSSDRPIESAKDDLLGRATFAARLAEDIRACDGEDSLVIGLFGSWGCGKTSIKNLVLARLARFRPRNPVIQFNPWQLSGMGGITPTYFRELCLVLEHDPTNQDSRDGAKKLGLYAKMLKFGGVFSSTIGGAIASVVPPENASAIAVIGAAAQVVGTSLQKAADVTAAGSDTLKASLEEQSLSSLKRELAESLRALKRPIVVVIDDIDRLTTAEILEVFQLVKANADFPNVIYLLLFEREIVTNALDQISGGRGSEFLEKIVQVGYHVPAISRASIQKVLFQTLDEYVEQPAIVRRWDQDLWTDLFLHGIVDYFQNLRHVYRFLNSFDFHVRQFELDGALEVNPVDLIGLETLRVFEPALFESLFACKRILTRDAGRSILAEVKQDEIDVAMSQLVEKVSAVRRDRARKLLEVLFPSTNKQFSGPNGTNRSKVEWLRESRICHPDFFEKYFLLTVGDGNVSQGEIDRLVECMSQSSRFASECRALAGRGLLNSAFQRLDTYKEVTSLDTIRCLSLGFAELGDLFDELPKLGPLELDEIGIAWRMIYFGLRRFDDEPIRFEIIHNAVKAAGGLIFPTTLVSYEERVNGREAGGSFLVDESRLPILKAYCIEKLRLAATNGDLRRHPRLEFLLWRWSEWASVDEVRGWVLNQCKTPNGAAWLLGLLVREIHVSSARTRIRYEFDLSVIERLADLPTIRQLAEKINESGLSDREKNALRAFQHSLKCRDEGKPEHDWGTVDEDFEAG